MVEMKQPPAVQRAGLDRPRVSALDEPPKEVVGLLPVRDAGEGAVLPFDEDAAVDQDFDQEARLTLREAEGADGLGALRRLLVDVLVRRRLGQVHRNSSAARGSKGAPPRLPPLVWTENPDRDAADAWPPR